MNKIEEEFLPEGGSNDEEESDLQIFNTYPKMNQNKLVRPRSTLNKLCETFHLDENKIINNHGLVDDHPFFLSARDLKKPDTLEDVEIVSPRGTVRGYKNRVRAGLANIEGNQSGKQIGIEEKGKIVVYTTSMRIVRCVHERCIRVKTILQTHMLQYSEKDVCMSKENQKELCSRLGFDSIVVPQIFADGVYIGNADDIEDMNETGKLRTMFKHFEKVCLSTPCDKCGGYQFLPCPGCHGSKKSIHRNHHTSQFITLRCTLCNENGLVKCEKCNTDKNISSL